MNDVLFSYTDILFDVEPAFLLWHGAEFGLQPTFQRNVLSLLSRMEWGICYTDSLKSDPYFVCVWLISILICQIQTMDISKSSLFVSCNLFKFQDGCIFRSTRSFEGPIKTSPSIRLSIHMKQLEAQKAPDSNPITNICFVFFPHSPSVHVLFNLPFTVILQFVVL